jgi:hypothetical protein
MGFYVVDVSFVETMIDVDLSSPLEVAALILVVMQQP